MPHEFDAQLHRLDGKIMWTVFYVPFSVPELYGTNNRLNVAVTIDGHAFAGTLLPSKQGHYLPFNAAMKAATRKQLGDTVHVVLEPDTAPRVVEVPACLQAALAADDAARATFESQPDYMRRESITHIMQAKADATRDRRIQALLERLRK
jgi:hypothetical protein